MRPLAAVLLLAAWCRADPVAGRADEVLKAFRGGGDLADLATKEEPDPWLVADDLCARGEYDAAEAYAKAAQGPDAERLFAYVGVQREAPTEPRVRETVYAAYRALHQRNYAQVVMREAPASAPDVASVRLLNAHGIALQRLWRPEQCAAAFLACGRAAEQLGWLSVAAETLHEGAASAYSRSDWRAALDGWERCLGVEQRRGQQAEVAALLGNVGNVQLELGNYPKALERYEQALEANRAVGNAVGAATALGNTGLVQERLGNYSEALAVLMRALGQHEELKNRGGVAWTLANIAVVQDSLGNYGEALEYLSRALDMSDALGDGAGVANALGDMGLVHEHLGEYEAALEYHQRSLKLKEDLGDRSGAATTRANIGIVYHSLGKHAQALTLYERALKEHEELGNRAEVATTLGNIGALHQSLGAYDRALEFYTRALEIMQESGRRAAEAEMLANIGNVHYARGDPAKALSFLEQALAIDEALDDRAGVARILGIIGNVHYTLHDYEQALGFHRRALQLQEALHDRSGIATTLGNMALVERGLGNLEAALQLHEQARAAAVELGTLETEIENLWGLASTHLQLGHGHEAVAHAREAVSKLPRLVARLSEELGATARSQWSGLFELGVYAAMQVEEPAQMLFFLESGRAGTLLELLGLREELHEVLLPAELRAAERAARDRVRATLKNYRAAVESGRDAEARWKELEAAQDGVAVVVQRIQREAKSQAAILYPDTATIADIQAALGPDEALLLYGLLSKRVVALVVTPEEAHPVDLGATDVVRPVLNAFQRAVERPDERGIAVPPHEQLPYVRKRAQQLLIEPLRIGEKVKRLHVSPDGPLAYVPFALLVPDREVAYVPSGTTYLLLHRKDKEVRGEAVLAVGDPTPQTNGTVTAMRSEFGPLPESRAEAKAVGDRVLLGTDATVSGLRRALAERARWRAVHLACHGKLDSEEPARSLLALAATAEDDGTLKCLDIYRMEVPADLVVLSACETARGKVYRAEGVVGFVRAFMFAGTPRVLVSLWKVDDAATRALMERFYELWKGGDVDAATALRQAQAHVAARKQWEHPYFWAAWQLWGLSE